MSSSGPGPPEDDGADSLALDERSIREYFAGRLPGRLQEIEDGWRQVRETAWSEEAVKTFHRLAHSLAGAGTTFGFAPVSAAARTLELRLKTAVQGHEPRPGDTEVEDLLADLRRAAALPG